MKFSYNTKDLYIGAVGLIYKKDKDSFSLKLSNIKIIYSKKIINIYYSDIFRDDYVSIGIDIMSKTEYYLWNELAYNGAKKYNGTYVIGISIPLSHFINKPKVSKKELLELYQKLNEKTNIVKDEPQKEPITDNILNLILKTNEKIKNMPIAADIKSQIVNELSDLGQYYVSRMIEIKKAEIDTLTLENTEYMVQLECIKKLVDIEGRIDLKSLAEIHALSKELETFKHNFEDK